ncbi:DNA-binding transcriptional response regulator, NtrC family, contains REC, AAA-type ATPase, and a Fis-type DNA-binding domains [Desulfonatronum thiosulfatophilum]|uniref:DNA-binding transcriptional response regulator, NtrC family, contains REC, AAA-type ATPase, and a Fis-type DNA-binding domains n=1 Tax=Desulfonatronum thiosulfatophilum TaxID=617002 RepID=A0A1G6DKM7_9BACT|nr:sigma-54 dependent transcriptional regulator [Desulfonatronum thiosulfatophilum]SDB45690.1 DNA-binding transcriptional response regulator, NtrC family, contains REC, AAA-type ATPase, and a Fis-type DNA-binding domains [Desulfonatronum thiosulfatophilum]
MNTSDTSLQQSILVVDDDPNILHLLQTRLSSAGYQVLAATNGEQALERLAEQPVDLVLSDVKMPGMNGPELLQEIKATWPNTQIILLTAYGRIPEAVAMVQQGAADYLTKPFDGRELVEKINALLARQDAPAAPGDCLDLTQVGLITGNSPAMAAVLALVKRVAPSEVTILIEGESGTGKELVAKMLHRLSSRSNGPLVVVDCGTTQASLLESELFGHVKGAFTHAVQEKQGLIQAAQGGTLFLDEIGNISSEMQTRLLRFLQERTVRKLGEIRTSTVDCRVIAATNADLLSMVRQGTFREDLYYRLKVVRLQVPPLRERREDIPLLADYFLQLFCKKSGIKCPSLSASTLRCLTNHSWPGNVRELRHVMEASALLSDRIVLEPEDIQLESEPPTHIIDAPLSLDESERKTIMRALEQMNWVQKDAAELLGISRRAMHYKVRKYGIEIPLRGERFQE